MSGTGCARCVSVVLAGFALSGRGGVAVGQARHIPCLEGDSAFEAGLRVSYVCGPPHRSPSKGGRLTIAAPSFCVVTRLRKPTPLD